MVPPFVREEHGHFVGMRHAALRAANQAPDWHLMVSTCEHGPYDCKYSYRSTDTPQRPPRRLPEPTLPVALPNADRMEAWRYLIARRVDWWPPSSVMRTQVWSMAPGSSGPVLVTLV
ncbi:unnamed protein product [Boreogadus saida]